MAEDLVLVLDNNSATLVLGLILDLKIPAYNTAFYPNLPSLYVF